MTKCVSVVDTHNVAGAVDQEHWVSDVVPVTGRILEDEDGVIWKVIPVDVRYRQHILAICAGRRVECCCCCCYGGGC